jgi:hypothetical protein
MLALDLQPVKKIEFFTVCPCLTSNSVQRHSKQCRKQGGHIVAVVTIEDGIIRVKELDIQDGKAAKVLAEYPEARWAEITRRALKIGLGYLKGGAQD